MDICLPPHILDWLIDQSITTQFLKAFFLTTLFPFNHRNTRNRCSPPPPSLLTKSTIFSFFSFCSVLALSIPMYKHKRELTRPVGNKRRPPQLHIPPYTPNFRVLVQNITTSGCYINTHFLFIYLSSFLTTPPNFYVKASLPFAWWVRAQKDPIYQQPHSFIHYSRLSPPSARKGKNK